MATWMQVEIGDLQLGDEFRFGGLLATVIELASIGAEMRVKMTLRGHGRWNVQMALPHHEQLWVKRPDPSPAEALARKMAASVNRSLDLLTEKERSATLTMARTALKEAR